MQTLAAVTVKQCCSYSDIFSPAGDRRVQQSADMLFDKVPLKRGIVSRSAYVSVCVIASLDCCLLHRPHSGATTVTKRNLDR